MRISLNYIKKAAKVPETVSNAELIDLIGSRLVEVEEVIELAPKYKGAYIVKVVSTEPIPNTHLNLCQIDAGQHTAEFSDTETIQIVCGAPNVHAGMLAVWLAPGSIVPSTYGNENFKLGTRKLQGYESNGMLAGADELDLATEHKTIAEIDPKMAEPGDDFATVFDLNDTIIDVENKSLTHRPDCFGLIGFAREVAGILGLEFEEPAPATVANYDRLQGSVEIDEELCPRYDCAVFDLPKNEPSKYLTATTVFLEKAGMRSIDPMVDLTNVMMLETGQPLHAFDYDKMLAVGGTPDMKIIVRAAKPGEQLQLLDGRTIECIPEDILVTSNDVPVALAGAMGGKNTEIDASTKRVVLESATFSLYHLRKTQMAHGIFSEAITRFTKGQPAAMTFDVLLRTIEQLKVSPVAVVDAYPHPTEKTVVKITTSEINSLLGTDYKTSLITETLENVGFEVVSKSYKAGKSLAFEIQSPMFSSMVITVPAWRTDIHVKEDIIEEVGRLLGYDNIPLTLPERFFRGAEVAPLIRLKTELRELLSSRLDMHELLTYSFVSSNLLEKVGQDPDDSYEIVNSISPELQRFRQQIVPSLLDKVRENIKSGHKDFTLYEMNQVTRRSYGRTDEDTPVLKTHLGVVELSDFYQLKAQILALFRDLRIEIAYAALSPAQAAQYPYLEPKRSAEILLNGQAIGAFGEARGHVLRNFKLEHTISAFELNLDEIATAPRQQKTSLKISKFPFVERDLTIQVASDAPFGRFDASITEFLDQQGLISEVTPVSIYQANADDATKNLSFHLKFSDPERTLDASAISAIMEQITVAVTKLGATTV